MTSGLRTDSCRSSSSVGSRTTWRMPTRPTCRFAEFSSKWRKVFLIFVADPRTVRLCKSPSAASRVATSDIVGDSVPVDGLAESRTRFVTAATNQRNRKSRTAKKPLRQHGPERVARTFGTTKAPIMAAIRPGPAIALPPWATHTSGRRAAMSPAAQRRQPDNPRRLTADSS